MQPRAFCATIRREFEGNREARDLAWARGALALCELYQGTDAERFATVLRQLANGPEGSATADGARWLLNRWHSSRAERR